MAASIAAWPIATLADAAMATASLVRPAMTNAKAY